MTTHRILITAAGIVGATLLSSPAQALDAAGLYIERTCVACHGPEGRVPAMDEYPKLAGQGTDYLLAQMKDIKSGARSNAHSVAMKNVMHLSSDEELAAIAAWLSALPE
jgi:cytochrome c